MSKFVHLHNHTHFSLLDASTQIDQLVKQTKDFGMSAVALTDHGNMSGAVQLWKACDKEKIKAIIGCELYVAADHSVKKKIKNQKEYHHLVVWAKDKEGYKNLCQLVAKSYLDGFYYKPRVDEELLKTHSKGLIASTACLAGSVPRTLLWEDGELIKDNPEKAIKKAAAMVNRFQDIFEDRFYLELQDHGIDLQLILNYRLMELAKETGAKLIWTNDCHFLKQDDFESHKAFKCIQGYKHVHDPALSHVYLPTHHFRSEESMRAILTEFKPKTRDFKYSASMVPILQAAMSRTAEIAEQCDFSFSSGTYYFPAVERKPEQTILELFREKVFEGFKLRVERGHVNPEKYGEYVKRLLYEINIISTMKFESYLIIIADMVQWAKSQGIPVGPGRGSAAGSIVSWCLQITEIDPVKYELLFERFLNPDRVSMPDIDLDFSKRRRGEVINYCIEKYGRENVAQIMTFHTLAPRRVIKDLGRVFELDVATAQGFASLIPDTPGKPFSLERAWNEIPEFKAATKLHSNIYNAALKLEDVNRHAGIHAAGLVITPTPLTDYAPLYQQAGTTDIAAAYDMRDLETIGLIKMDLLGLKTLDIIADTIQMVQRKYRIDIDWDKIDIEDPSIYKMFAEGKTKGVFQFESRGMRQDLMLLEPDCFEHIVAMNALYRPGPNDSGMTKSFIERKRGKEAVVAIHPACKDIVLPTYGVLVYQEQVMKVIQRLAGYSLGQADIVRKAMGKKDDDLMRKELNKFVLAACENGYVEKEMKDVADAIMKFARYGFNRAHAAAYAYIAFQTAYLLKNYPLEFMCSVLTAEAEDNKFEKIREYIGDTKRLGIRILQPSVNKSDSYFKVEGNAIRYGLAAIKGIGEGKAMEIIAERNSRGAFKSFVDFLYRLKPGKGIASPLIAAGATECLGLTIDEDRVVHQSNYPDLVKTFKKNVQAKGQVSLLSPEEEDEGRRENYQLKPADAMSPKDIAAMEKDALGLWLTKHPLDSYQHLIADDLASLKDAGEQSQKAFRATFICVINEIVFRMTQSGKRLAILCVEDMTAESEEIKVWGDEDIQAMKDSLVVGAVVRLKGKAGHDKNDRFQFNVRSAERLDVPVVIEEDKEEVETNAQSESAF